MPTNPKEQTPDAKSEIERLKEELRRKEEILKQQGTEAPEKEIPEPEKKPAAEKIAAVKKEIEQEEEPDKKEVKGLLPESMNDPEILREIKDVIDSGKSKEIVQLAYLAFEKGAKYALEIAGKTNDPSTLAEFRGIITGELHEKLKAKNKL